MAAYIEPEMKRTRKLAGRFLPSLLHQEWARSAGARAPALAAGPTWGRLATREVRRPGAARVKPAGHPGSYREFIGGGEEAMHVAIMSDTSCLHFSGDTRGKSCCKKWGICWAKVCERC